MNEKIQPQGFTLLELVITFVILGIISLIAVPNVVGVMQKIHINAAAQKLASDIRYIRELAISRHSDSTIGIYGIEFNQGNNSYELFRLVGNAKTTVKDPHRATPLIVDYDTLAEFRGVTISSASMCAGNSCTSQELRIDAFGKPLDASNAIFTSPVSITLQNGSQTRTVQVNPQTAFTEVL